MPNVTHDDVSNYFTSLGESNVDVKFSYRWNLLEFNGPLPDSAKLTLLAYESPTLITENTETKPHLNTICAFNILGKEGVSTSNIADKAAQDEVLDHCMEIAKEFARKIITDSEKEDGLFYRMVQRLSFQFTKVGPVTLSSLYGYRCEFSINPAFNTNIDPDKWQ